MVAQCVVLSHHSSRALSLILNSDRSFIYSPHVCMGFLLAYWFPLAIQKHGR